EVQFDEIPFEFTVHIARGDCHLPWVRWNPEYLVKPTPGPKWFQHMDANGDGDVNQREFLGTIEQFECLDVDRDGFIDPREAEAAKGG
ncbi:MAG TPA: hypothetical protein VHB77_01510, partial [Planctomycetaceae bacterium]|nr:hypothetical protein [Planctomycetaceae bacterium]